MAARLSSLSVPPSACSTTSLRGGTITLGESGMMFRRKKTAAEPVGFGPSRVVQPYLRAGFQAAATLSGGGPIVIVGTEFHQQAVMRAAHSRKQGVPEVERALAQLVPEPSNRHDPDAVAVFIGVELVGYLGKGASPGVRAAVARCVANGVPATCVATFITAGPVSAGEIGVTIDAKDYGR